MELPLWNANHTMQLLNKTCLKGVPSLRSQDGKGDEAIVHLKFFIGCFTWYLTEFDPETGEAFGLVHNQGVATELGYFHLQELADLHVGYAVELDRYWNKQTVGEVKEFIEAHKHAA